MNPPGRETVVRVLNLACLLYILSVHISFSFSMAQEIGSGNDKPVRMIENDDSTGGTGSGAGSDTGAPDTYSCSTVPANQDIECSGQIKISVANALAVVPYDESSLPLFHKPKREFNIAGHKIVIKQDWQQLGVAAVVWDAALVLCEYLEQNQDVVKGKSVIELGAGSGIVGIVTAYLGGKVTTTEREIAMDYLKSVVEENIDMKNYRINTKTLDWTSDLRDFPEPFDVILGADVIYIEDTFQDLLKTFIHLSDRKTVIYISCKIRYDRDTQFLDLMRQYFDIQKVFKDKFRDISIFRAKRS